MTRILFDIDDLLPGRRSISPWDELPPWNEVPVRLTVAGVDLLGWEDWAGKGSTDGLAKDGISTPILSMARNGIYALRYAKQLSGRSYLHLGENGEHGELFFEMSFPDILVYSTPYKKTAKACYDELLRTWSGFAEQVRQFVLDKFADLPTSYYHDDRQMEGWKQWLNGESDVIETSIPGWTDNFNRYELAFKRIVGEEPCR